MNTKSNIIIGVGVAIALVISLIAYSKTPTQLLGSTGPQGAKGDSIVGPAGNEGPRGPQGLQGARGPQGPAGFAASVPTLGSVSGPEVASPYLTVGGVRHEYYATILNSATTTPCVFQTPSSTSTLLWSSFQISSTSPIAMIATLAKSTVPNATTTVISTFGTISANVKGTAMYSTTTASTVIDGFNVLAPNTFITWGAKGEDGSAVNSPGGMCRAEFLVQ